MDSSLQQWTLFDGPVPDLPSGKTCQEPSPQTPAETLLPWLEQWLGWNLTCRQMDGKTPAWQSAPAGSSSGAYWTRNSSEFRSGAVVCSLSGILETGQVAPRYFLSATACRGILRRAEKRGKELPAALKSALQAVASRT